MITRLPHRSVVKISGDDKFTFLNGLLTQDVLKLKHQTCVFSAFLTPQGKFLTDLFLIHHDDAIFIDMETSYALDFVKKMTFFKLRSNVTIEHTDMHVYVSRDNHEDIICVQDPRLNAMGYRIYGDVDDASTDFTWWDVQRCQHGIPDGTRDIPFERGVILEYGFDELHAIDWDKGCFLGQELTARTRYRGLVRKRLLPLQWDASQVDIDVHDVNIFKNDKPVGMLRSYVVDGNIGYGLGLIRVESFETDDGFDFSGVTMVWEPVESSNKDVTSPQNNAPTETPVQITKPDWVRIPIYPI